MSNKTLGGIIFIICWWGLLTVGANEIRHKRGFRLGFNILRDQEALDFTRIFWRGGTLMATSMIVMQLASGGLLDFIAGCGSLIGFVILFKVMLRASGYRWF